MLSSFKTYLRAICMFLGIKETGCSNKFSPHLALSVSMDFSQQKLLPAAFKVRKTPVCIWSLTLNTPEFSAEEIFLCAKQAMTVSLSILVHFRRTCSLDNNSHTVLNLPPP